LSADGTPQERIALPRSLADAMIAHARAEAPLEACGIVAGREGDPTRFFPAVNAARSPVRYNIDPQDLLRITLEIERSGEELWGIFHSHPATQAYPSRTDIQLAFYPQAFYLIASLADREHPVLRAFRIRGEQVTEVAVDLV
jgi:proteasome lid subunit RPN8/RPN11